MSAGRSLSFEQTFTVQVKQEETFVMRQSDWVRLRARVERLKKQRREFSAAAWAFVGVGVSAIFSMVSWAPAYRALTDAQQMEFAWVWPALVAALVAGVVFAIGGFWGAHVMKDAAAETVDSVAAYMDELHDVRELLAA
ncbi:hypothetical protein QWJ90_06825 [Microbacterium oryzae]|uniref:hypothetical protein n=1 Tax=Microbacterium oryzae TaxID=743009 RepID=UPI0025AEDB49|nr:hypothetical protein [Microbacterium oryzae]MDN3310639.1 hypothetical protein [Microbacterium oryzae]